MAGEPDDRGDARQPESPPAARTKHGELSLDQIGSLMPGLGSLMPVISDRFGWMVHAGRGGNWKLARYQLRQIRHLFRVGKTTRPKWTEPIDAYVDGSLARVEAAIDAADLDAFEEAARRAVDEANRIHAEYGFEYIVYQVPAEPPSHMSVAPPETDED